MYFIKYLLGRGSSKHVVRLLQFLLKSYLCGLDKLHITKIYRYCRCLRSVSANNRHVGLFLIHAFCKHRQSWRKLDIIMLRLYRGFTTSRALYWYVNIELSL